MKSETSEDINKIINHYKKCSHLMDGVFLHKQPPVKTVINGDDLSMSEEQLIQKQIDKARRYAEDLHPNEPEIGKGI